MLAGLAGLAIPAVIHLIARHRFPVQDFPTTRLLEREERFNVFQMRLVDIPQLLLRLLLLAVLVLLMARLFAPGASSHPAPRNLVVLIDCSASMRMQAPGKDASVRKSMIKLAKATAAKLLADISRPSQCALVTAGTRTDLLAPLQPDPAQAIDALGKVDAVDGAGPGLVEGLAQCCDLVRGRREVKSQVIVLTDMRSGAFDTRNQLALQRIKDTQHDLGGALDVVFADLSAGTGENLAVVDAYVRGGSTSIGDDAHVIAKIANYAAKPQKATVQLAAGKRGDGKPERIELAPMGRVDVDMTVRTTRAAREFLQVTMTPEDAMPWDNIFSVPLVISELKRVLLVNGSGGSEARGPSAVEKLSTSPKPDQGLDENTIDGAKILQLALNPSREIGLAGGTGIITTPITPDALPQQTLSQYDLIVLYDVSMISEQAWQDLHAAVSDGRGLLIVCSGEVNAAKFNKVFAAARTSPDAKDGKPLLISPAELGNDKLFAPPVGVDQAASMHPVLEVFSDTLQGDLSVIRFTKLRELRQMANGATVMIRGTGGVPLAVEMPVGRGKAVLLTFGLELDRANLARTRAFLPLTWRLVNYLTGALKTRPPDVLTAGEPAVLDVSERQFALVPELELVSAAPPEAGDAQAKQENGKLRKRLKIADDATVFLPGMPAGRYTLGKPGLDDAAGAGYARNVTVNPSNKESRMDRLPAADVAALFGPRARVSNVADAAGLAPRGLELAGWLVLLLILLYALEAAIGFILSVKREKQRLAA